MNVDHIEEIILTRQFQILGSEAAVIVEVGRPERYPVGQDFFCAYRINGLGNGRVQSAAGIDQIQAVLLALKKIGASLYSSAEYKAGKLYWIEAGNRDLGLPTPEGLNN